MPIEVVTDDSNLDADGSAQTLVGTEGGPDAIVSMACSQVGVGADGGVAQSIGIATRAAQFVVSNQSTNGAGTSECQSHSDTKLIAMPTVDNTTIDATATLGTIAGNAIPLTWNTTHATNAYDYALMCFSQMDDVDAREILITANGNTDVDLAWVAPPDLLVIASSFTLAAASSSEAHSHMNLYFAARNDRGTTHGSVSGSAEDSSGSSDASRGASNSDLTIRSDASSGRDSNWNVAAHLDPQDTGGINGYRLTTTNKGTSGNAYFYVLAIRGVLAEVVDGDAPTSVGDYSLANTTGFQPDAILTCGQGRASFGTAANYHVSVGMHDRQERGAHMWAREDHGSGTTENERRWSTDVHRVEGPVDSVNNLVTVNRGFSMGRIDYEATTVTATAYDWSCLMMADRPKLRGARSRSRGRN